MRTIKTIQTGLRFSLVFLIIYSVTGCIGSRPPYPSYWPVRKPGVSPGSYSGEYHFALARILKFGTTVDTANKVSVLQVAGSPALKISLQYRDTLSHREAALAEPAEKMVIRHKRDGLWVFYRQPSQAGNPLVGPQKSYALLSKGADGSLIVKQGDRGWGLVFFLFPIGFNEYRWYRVVRDSVEVGP